MLSEVRPHCLWLQHREVKTEEAWRSCLAQIATRANSGFSCSSACKMNVSGKGTDKCAFTHLCVHATPCTLTCTYVQTCKHTCDTHTHIYMQKIKPENQASVCTILDFSSQNPQEREPEHLSTLCPANGLQKLTHSKGC